MIDRLINKEVQYYTHGKNLFFYLSMGLFSSNAIDSGSDLFLQQILGYLNISRFKNLLDAGCGVGTIGIVMKALYPHLQVTATDRDALALAITKKNAERNHLSITTSPGLDSLRLIESPSIPLSTSLQQDAQQYDLILTNIPAKAGQPVLLRFITNGLSQLSPQGVFGFVIVDTLKEKAAKLCREAQAEIIYRFDGLRHTVFLLSSIANTRYDADNSFPGAYHRITSEFHCQQFSYHLQAVYNIPGFDTIPFEAELASRLIPKSSPSSLTIWNPGQGHIAMLALKIHSAVDTMRIAGRDLLALYTTAYSVKQEYPEIRIEIFHQPSLAEFLLHNTTGFSDKKDLCIIFPDHIPRVSFYQQLVDTVNLLHMNTSGDLLIAAKSSIMAPFSRGIPTFSPLVQKKQRGFRAILFQHLYI